MRFGFAEEKDYLRLAGMKWMYCGEDGVDEKNELQHIRETAPDFIEDNYKAANNSFLYYLHEKGMFDTDAFMKLLNCINSMETGQMDILIKLYFIQNETLKHIIYHFDPNDMGTIKNLPADYWEYLSGLEESVRNYMRTSFGNNNDQEL